MTKPSVTVAKLFLHAYPCMTISLREDGDGKPEATELDKPTKRLS